MAAAEGRSDAYEAAAREAAAREAAAREAAKWIAGHWDPKQRGIAGERGLGLPKEPRTDRDVPFPDLAIGTHRQQED